MRVLVTGGTGFVGRHLVPLVLARGHEVTVVARDTARARALPWFGAVRFVADDLRDPAGAFARFGEPEAVAHLAWSGLPNYGELFHFEENLPRDYRFLKGLVEAGSKQVLVTGTCFEYGLQDGCLREDAATGPRNPYALAKDTLRRFLEELRRHRPFVLQWARLFYMHGPGQNPKSVLAQLDRAIEEGAPSFDLSGGEQLRDYLPVASVAEDLCRLLDHPECDGVVNVCSGVPVSVRRLVEEHVARRGASIQLAFGRHPYSPHEPMAFWGERAKLSAL